MKLELYFFKECPYCKKVLKKINDLKLEDKIIFKNIKENKEACDFHTQTTGKKTVPCLYIDNKPLFESSDICNWLEENQKKL